jgi:hypothetical protein
LSCQANQPTRISLCHQGPLELSSRMVLEPEVSQV